MSKAVNSKWKKTFPDTIGNQNRPATGVDDTQEFETGAFPQYMANDPVRYDLQNAAMSQLMSNDARLKEMVDARGKELDDHKVDPGAHKTGIAGNAATATKVVTTAATGASANIAEASMGGSDSARIRVSGAENAGELALETANDGDEAIVARQYTGVYTNAVRTAKILDESGNTSFPGTVVAPKFTGTLNGNASTATKLATPRTLSLSGKAAGSTTFDGSANVTINVTNVNADTATKLSTARKINITGNATGAAAFDGSADANISVTVNESKHASAADIAATLQTTNDTGAIENVKFYWVGKDSQPMWLWGSNTKPSETYVYNPSHFHVAAADSDGNGANIANTYLKKATVIDVIYPVGSIYMSMSATNPHDLFGVGTWERISQGRMLLGADDSTYKAGATGGEATHTLTAKEMPRHNHYSTTSWANLQGHFGSGDNTAYFFRSDTDGICSNSDGSARNGLGRGGNLDDRYSRIKINASHNHTIQNDGDSQPHNNMSPYLVCYIWQRTA